MDEAVAWLCEKALRFNQPLSADVCNQIKSFMQSLGQYNLHTNLVSNAEPKALVENHLIDSLSLLPYIKAYASQHHQKAASLKLIDIGSGAGFPGLALAICYPGLKVCLVDSVGKKVKFLQSCASEIGLSENVEALNVRAEILAREKNYRESFDLATARAVGTCDLVCELGLPFLKVGGCLMIQKSRRQIEAEVEKAKLCLPQLGARLKEIVELDEGVLGKQMALMLAEKIAPTPKQFPRTFAQISRNPLGEARQA